jgi:dTMP kinase
MLIAIEGLDGAGKSLQIELIKKELSNVIVFKYPTKNTPELNAYLERKLEIEQKRLFYLFLEDIKKEQDAVKDALRKNNIVLLDRYVFSTIAYEKDSITYEDAKKIVEQMNFVIPDKVILLDIPANIAQQRKQKQKELDRYEENAEYLEMVRNGFLRLYKEKFLCKNWYLIDGRKSIEEIHREILGIIKTPY